MRTKRTASMEIMHSSNFSDSAIVIIPWIFNQFEHANDVDLAFILWPAWFFLFFRSFHQSSCDYQWCIVNRWHFAANAIINATGACTSIAIIRFVVHWRDDCTLLFPLTANRYAHLLTFMILLFITTRSVILIHCSTMTSNVYACT